LTFMIERIQMDFYDKRIQIDFM